MTAEAKRGWRKRSTQGGMPPGCFAERVRKLLKRKGGARKKSAKSEKECATVCRERIYVGESVGGVELTWGSLPQRQLLCQDNFVSVIPRMHYREILDESCQKRSALRVRCGRRGSAGAGG